MNNKDFLIISILTFITVLVWIFFDAYHTYKTSTIPEDLKVYLTPLKINITQESIEKIKSRPNIFQKLVPAPSEELSLPEESSPTASPPEEIPSVNETSLAP